MPGKFLFLKRDELRSSVRPMNCCSMTAILRACGGSVSWNSSRNLINRFHHLIHSNPIHEFLAERNVLEDRLTNRKVRVVLMMNEPAAGRARRPQRQLALAKQRNERHIQRVRKVHRPRIDCDQTAAIVQLADPPFY